MNQESVRNFQVYISGWGRWLLLLSVLLLVGYAGLGWLLQSFLILLTLLLVAPIVVFLGFRWWLQRNLIQDACPVCGYESVSLNQTEFRCPSCAEPLKVEKGHFQRLTPPGTIDVKAVEVSAQVVED